MDNFALIGYPIGHSKSPELFSAAYHGRYSYSLIERGNFSECWTIAESLECKALNVTAPFKAEAAEFAGWRSPEVERIGAANILLMEDGIVRAFNSDYLGIKLLLEKKMPGRRVAVVGYGGSGKAAAAAVTDCGRELLLFRHDELKGGINADVIIYTLPRCVEDCGKLEADIILEANYRNPCLSSRNQYLGGEEWLMAQAVTGYELMTGEYPDIGEMKKII